MSGIIYCITCLKTGRKYVGQALMYKEKKGKPYKYGIKGRWCNHVASAYKNRTPLEKDINTYGSDAFTIEELITVPINELDQVEASYIEKLNTLIPNGYNVYRHSSSKTGDGNVLEYYSNKLISIDVKPVKRNNTKAYVRLYLRLKDGKSIRMSVGASLKETYDDVLIRALTKLIPYENNGIPVYLSGDLLAEDLLSKYEDKLEPYKGKIVDRIRVTPFKSRSAMLIALYIRCEGEEKRITFGGRTITPKDAYNIAMAFIERLGAKEIIRSPKLVSII